MENPGILNDISFSFFAVQISKIYSEKELPSHGKRTGLDQS